MYCSAFQFTVSGVAYHFCWVIDESFILTEYTNGGWSSFFLNSWLSQLTIQKILLWWNQFFLNGAFYCKFLLLPFLAVTFSVKFFTEQHLLTAHNLLTDYILGKEIRTFWNTSYCRFFSWYFVFVDHDTTTHLPWSSDFQTRLNSLVRTFHHKKRILTLHCSLLGFSTLRDCWDCSLPLDITAACYLATLKPFKLSQRYSYLSGNKGWRRVHMWEYI